MKIEMLNGIHILVVGILLIEQCIFTSNFLISNEEELLIVPSVAFRYHSPTLASTAFAQPSDDWILYAQGKAKRRIFIFKKKCVVYLRLVFRRQSLSCPPCHIDSVEYCG